MEKAENDTNLLLVIILCIIGLAKLLAEGKKKCGGNQ